jgi:uncharacterized membrane protein
MKRSTSPAQWRLLVLGAPFLSAICLAQSPTFSVQVLGDLSGGGAAIAHGINTAGEVAGNTDGSLPGCTNGCAVIWRKGTPTPLGRVAGAGGSKAYSLNNAGQVPGAVTTSTTTEAVIWKNGTPTVLPSLGPQYTETVAFSINDSGQAVGYALEPLGDGFDDIVQVEWNASTLTVLGGVSGCSRTQTTEYLRVQSLTISNNGLVVGTIGCGDYTLPVVWHGTTATPLPVVGGSGHGGGQAVGVNDLDLIVGLSGPLDSYGEIVCCEPVAWNKGVLTRLARLSPGYASVATAVNNRGIIVGQSATIDSTQYHATLWNSVGADAQDLNSLISASMAEQYILTDAIGINDSCAILVNGFDRNAGADEAFVLTPTDPSSCVNGLIVLKPEK